MFKANVVNFVALFLMITIRVASAGECIRIGQSVSGSDNCCNDFLNPGAVAIDGICKLPPTGCVAKDVQISQNQGCCAGLNNVDGVCKDPSIVDSSLISCDSNPNICPQNLGCYPQRENDLFKGPAESDADIVALEILQNKFTQQIVADPRPVNQFCITNSQCDSYNCIASKCTTKKICRKADSGEFAVNGQCDLGLMVDSFTGLCKVISPANQSPITASTGPTGNQCRFNFPESMKPQAEYSIALTRAMEWFLVSISEDDCLQQNAYLKGIGTNLINKRRELLKMFNTGMKKIDENNKVLLASKDPETDPNALVTIHGSTLTNKELAGRLTSGVDTLQIMIERNLVFQAYEEQMLILTSLTMSRIKALTDLFDSGVRGWGDHDLRSWTVPEEIGVSADGKTSNFRHVSYRLKQPWPFQAQSEENGMTCRGAGSLGNRKVYKRWDRRSAFRASLLNDNILQNELALITNPTITDGAHQFTPSNLLATKAALNAEVARGPRTLFLLDMTNPMVLQGSGGFLMSVVGDTSLGNSFAVVRNSMQSYMNSLKLDPSLSAFNHEPELLPLQAKDCDLNSASPGCAKYSAFIDNISRIGLANILAYSTHNRSDYQWFFNGDVWRRRLLKTWIQNLNYLTDYYTKMAEFRTQQNNCLVKSGDYASTFLDNSLAGINEGAQNYYVGTDYVDTASGQTQSLSSGPRFNSQSSFEFKANLLKSLSWNTQSSTPKTTAVSGSGAGALSATNAASMAKRVTSAKDLTTDGGNDKSINSKSNASNSISSGSSGSGGGTGSGSTSADSSNSLSATQVGKASLGDEMTDKAKGKSDADDIGTKGLVKGSGSNDAGFGAAAGAGPGAGGYSAGFGSGSGATGALGAEANGGKNPTGMSDEEKDVMMANFERTKSRYDTKEDDSIFTIINKTYVRNLDKILKKKPSSSPE